MFDVVLFEKYPSLPTGHGDNQISLPKPARLLLLVMSDSTSPTALAPWNCTLDLGHIAAWTSRIRSILMQSCSVLRIGFDKETFPTKRLFKKETVAVPESVQRANFNNRPTAFQRRLVKQLKYHFVLVQLALVWDVVFECAPFGWRPLYFAFPVCTVCRQPYIGNCLHEAFGWHHYASVVKVKF